MELTMNKVRRNELLLVLAAFIWGVAFVAQSKGAELISPFTFNGLRMLLGALVLTVLIEIRRLTDKKAYDGEAVLKRDENPCDEALGKEKGKAAGFIRRIPTTVQAGIACGVMLTIASNFQQMGVDMGATAGKAGFLTACYVILVPVLGLLLGRRCNIRVWIGVALTVTGMYLLCIKGDFVFQSADIMLILCAFFYALHIMVVDHFAPIADGVRIARGQFLVCGIISMVIAFFTEMSQMGGLQGLAASLLQLPVIITLLYMGIMSCGVAYTLQIVGQNGVNPTVASILMSLESVFSALAGWAILGQELSPREAAGCLLIFVAIILAQLPVAG